jgi:hypothetical protein
MRNDYNPLASLIKARINHRITEPTTQHDMTLAEWKETIAANGRTNQENFLFWCYDTDED